MSSFHLDTLLPWWLGLLFLLGIVSFLCMSPPTHPRLSRISTDLPLDSRCHHKGESFCLQRSKERLIYFSLNMNTKN